VNYPDTVKTNSEKLAFCYAAQEKLRQMHNVVGAWYREGEIATKNYDSLPTTWQKSLSTASKDGALSETAWKEFKDGAYDTAEKDVIGELGAMKEAVMKDAVLVASVDLDKTLSAATAEK
jgi:hypothetical protein